MSSSQSTSSRALLYFSERVEDATEAVKGLIGGASAVKYVDTSDDVVRAQLESDRDEVRLEGLKTVIGLISKGREASGYFASVVKLSSNANLEIRKLVYIVVRRYARKQPEIALLGINSFQRDLQDRNEVIRAMALRVLAGLRLKLAASVVELAIGRCVRDSSFHVRKAAALALIKCTNISPNAPQLFKAHIVTLLNDRNPSVLAATLVAWCRICPNDVELLHPHFRKICFALGDMNEWGQQKALLILGLYAKRCLRQSLSSHEKVDKDLELLLNRTEELLHSQSAAVVRSAARLLFALGREERRKSIVFPMLRLATGEDDIAYIALLDCRHIVKVAPDLFRPHIADFLPRSSLTEPVRCTATKLDILSLLCDDKDSANMVVPELMEQANHHPSPQISAAAVGALGAFITRCPDEKQRSACMRNLIGLLKNGKSSEMVVASTMSVIGKVIDSAAEADVSAYIVRLASLLFTQPSAKDVATRRRIKLVSRNAVKSADARATIYWLVGQYARLEVEVRSANSEDIKKKSIAELFGLDVLRRGVINFAKEDAVARLQILTLSTKLFVFLSSLDAFASSTYGKSLPLIHSYVLRLARYDLDFDVRDRGRLCMALTERLNGADAVTSADDDGRNEKLSGVVLRGEQVLHILFDKRSGRTNQGMPSADDSTSQWNVLSMILGERQAASLPQTFPDFFAEPWADPGTLPPASVRDPVSISHVAESVSAQTDRIPSPLPVLPPAISSPRKETPLSSATQKYRDLDAFLESEDEAADAAPVTRSDSDHDVHSEHSSEEAESENGDDDDDVNESESEAEALSDGHAADHSNAQSLSTSTPFAAPPNEENAWAS